MLDELENKYKHKAKIYGSVFLLKPMDAIEFISDGVNEGRFLSGVEGFSITESGACQPHQEHSNDISDTELEHTEFVEETKKFILSREHLGIWFEIVFDDN